jgi:hypothetical protein
MKQQRYVVKRKREKTGEKKCLKECVMECWVKKQQREKERRNISRFSEKKLFLNLKVNKQKKSKMFHEV